MGKNKNRWAGCVGGGGSGWVERVGRPVGEKKTPRDCGWRRSFREREMMCYIRRGAEGCDGAAVSAAADGEVEKCEIESISATCVCVCAPVYSYGGGRFVVSSALLPPPRGQLNFSDITSASAVIPSARAATPNAATARG